MQRDVASPEAYLEAVPASQLPIVEHLRGLIRRAVPGAVEKIEYGMLGYDDGGPLFALAAQKNYVSLYVMATEAVEDMAEELAGLCHGKSCLRFKKLSAVPTETIARLLAHAAVVRERACKKLP